LSVPYNAHRDLWMSLTRMPATGKIADCTAQETLSNDHFDNNTLTFVAT